jgi:serine protease AprX
MAAGSRKGGHDNTNTKHRSGEGKKAKPAEPNSQVKRYKADDVVSQRKNGNPLRTSRVIVTLVPGAQLPNEFKRYAKGRKLNLINGVVLELPNGVIRHLESRPEIFQLHDDRKINSHNYRTSVTVGAQSVRETLGLRGDGIGIAVIDSGISNWHNDLTRGGVIKTFPYGNQRVTTFVDFVGGHAQPYDDNGHGTHVSGIIAGNGYDSNGEKRGIAPNASLVSLKVLDANGTGTISSIIAALEWIAANHATHNIRVVNMSVGASVRESFWTDPLTLATKRVTDLGITVVAASGNLGKNQLGGLQYGGITAPANAPWVLTVGASSTEGTFTRKDDVMAGYSSSGPTHKDFIAKPDLVAPGTGTMSLSAPGSAFYSAKAQYLLEGKPRLGFKPYLTLSGTSMAAPVVSGTVALMLQANPTLTPNLIKAILQYTAEQHEDYNALRQGAGFLNTLGAVRLAKFYRENKVGSRMPVQKIWSRELIWGNHRISGGYINPKGNAWSNQIVWGAAHGLNGLDDNIVWGTTFDDNIVWGTTLDDNIVWGTSFNDNIVWGTNDATFDNIVWGTSFDDNIVWGTMFDADNIVWGTSLDDNIVWGTDCGGADCDNIVWGTMDQDNIVWGTAATDDNIVWGTSLDDNIVWGTSGADVTWGNNDEEAVAFADENLEPLPDVTLEFGEVPEVVVEAVVETVAAEEPVVVEAVVEPVAVEEETMIQLNGGI